MALCLNVNLMGWRPDCFERNQTWGQEMVVVVEIPMPPLANTQILEDMQSKVGGFNSNATTLLQTSATRLSTTWERAVVLCH
jgi:hypothetical protein